MPVPVRTSFGLRRRGGKTYNQYQHKVDVDMLNTVKSALADVSSGSQHFATTRALCSDGSNVSQHTLFDVQQININLTLIVYIECHSDQLAFSVVIYCCLLLLLLCVSYLSIRQVSFPSNMRVHNSFGACGA